MKHIKTITNKDLLGDNSFSNAKPRRTARAILVNQKGEIALLYSKEYNIYSLPGGGIEEGESYEDTLVREVKEESGLVVKKDSIKEFGYVRRIEKGRIEDIFIQENYYLEDIIHFAQLNNYLLATGIYHNVVFDFNKKWRGYSVRHDGDYKFILRIPVSDGTINNTPISEVILKALDTAIDKVKDGKQILVV
jgi:8-oxo-dGTP pyrophosphatase MutT (NUDIX family)